MEEKNNKMPKLIAKKDFYLKDKLYKTGSEVKTKDLEIIIKLNEGGFIKPISIKDFIGGNENGKNTR